MLVLQGATRQVETDNCTALQTRSPLLPWQQHPTPGTLAAVLLTVTQLGMGQGEVKIHKVLLFGSVAFSWLYVPLPAANLQMFSRIQIKLNSNPLCWGGWVDGRWGRGGLREAMVEEA